ncbi:hypothetical protein HYH03_012564 [Edaphochlamys debaryana]|uniref:Protein kinase domain-containing protein n=1 Tax=Edaphochlamys debaryana TaxID=47281 RepID=A0A835XY00_9CHLO|nr:hypothetical protein HYH03_012564 [Edaphochlamys debaryana]|eukprot:KAG2488945.1 hypothetical protein HYH03_012564 [Edaphochlamys debaryana]
MWRVLRQSVGAHLVVDGCIMRRRAGLPYTAAVVNMLAAPRLSTQPGAQQVFIVDNLTASTTRSPQPVGFGEVINMYDFATNVLADSSLAFQGLYLGGYTYTVRRTYYVVDNLVDPSCLTTHTGTDCVALLVKQLDEQDAPHVGPRRADSARSSGSGGGGSRSSGGGGGDSSSTSETTVAIAVAVPCAVVLAALAVLALFVLRRRRQDRDRAAAAAAAEAKRLALGDVEAGGAGGVGSAGGPGSGKTGSGRTPPMADTGCVFLGLDEGQPLPEWSPKAHEQEGDEFEEHLPATTQPSAPLSGPPTAPLHERPPLAAAPSDPCARGSMELGLARARGQGSSLTARSGLVFLKPVLASEDMQAQAQAQAQSSLRTPEAADVVRITPPAPPKDMDVVTELGLLAQELRATVRDVQIRLEAVLGSGSFGTVYKGTWQGLQVAVKTVAFSASPDRRKRALQEAALCQSINHPNIIATYASELQPIGGVQALQSPSHPTHPGGMGSELGDGSSELDCFSTNMFMDWRLYIVMEYADAGPMSSIYGNRDIWAGPDRVNMSAVVSLALGIARALSHLHSKRIVHGDLNPNNVMLKRDPSEPSGYAVKIGDFGLSVMLPDHRTHLSNLRMGTMFYICPAVVMKGHVGPASDVFALGVMLWELYHGRRAGIRTPEGPRYCSFFPAFPPSCPPAYRNVALHCLQRQPQNRPPATVVEGQLEWLQNCMRIAAEDPSRPLPPPPIVLAPAPVLTGVAAGEATPQK